MRFALFTLVVALLAAVAMAVPPSMVSVIMSWPNGTPDSVVQAAKDMVRKGKGKITHEYEIIKGFACDMPKNQIPKVQALNTQYPVLVEGDGVVTTQSDDKEGKMGINF